MILTYIFILTINFVKCDLQLSLDAEAKIKLTARQLANHVLDEYMSQYRCVFVVGDEGYLTHLQTAGGTSLLRMSPSFTEECQDEIAYDVLAKSFIEHCEG